MQPRPIDPKSDPTHIRWLKRFRPPVLFVLAGLVVMWGPKATPADLALPEWFASTALIAARMLFIAAIGWSATTLVDGLIKRRLAGLRLDQPDNLAARKIATRLDVVRRIWIVLGGTITVAAALTVVPGIQQVGISLFASAGITGLVLGIAARPVLTNLISGLQIAFTQPIRIDDAVVIEGEWGWIEEIGLFFVVVKIWDWRRLVVPLSYFVERPFQNWTRQTASIIGSVTWSLDYRAPVKLMRAKLDEICEESALWSGDVVNLQVVETGLHTITVRALASARTSPQAWDLRCLIREEMISWLQTNHPEALPRIRADADLRDEAAHAYDPPRNHLPEKPFDRDHSLDFGPAGND